MENRTRIQQNDLLLHEAVIKNEPAAVREALERPTDVNCRNNVSRSPNEVWKPSTLNFLNKTKDEETIKNSELIFFIIQLAALEL